MPSVRRLRTFDFARWKDAARRALPHSVFDYVAGGAGDEQALRRNRTAFDDWTLVPRVLRDVAVRDTSTELLGARLDAPVMIAPTGLNGLIWPRGDQALARAAADAGIPFVMSTAANATIDAVARAAGCAPWFQLYVAEPSSMSALVAQASAAACPVLMVTVDMPVSGRRTRDVRNRFSIAAPRRLYSLLGAARTPGWALRQLRATRPLATPLLATPATRQFDASFDWEALARLRDRWPRALVVKGVLSCADAGRAAALGIDGIVVSNHGGRQLDAAPSPLSVLPGIAEAVGRRLVVLVDGGFENGEQVLEAVALGARAVLVGRAPLYGLATQGETGVRTVLEQFRDGIDRTLALLGCRAIAEVEREHVRHVSCPSAGREAESAT